MNPYPAISRHRSLADIEYMQTEEARDPRLAFAILEELVTHPRHGNLAESDLTPLREQYLRALLKQ